MPPRLNARSCVSWAVSVTLAASQLMLRACSRSIATCGARHRRGLVGAVVSKVHAHADPAACWAASMALPPLPCTRSAHLGGCRPALQAVMALLQRRHPGQVLLGGHSGWVVLHLGGWQGEAGGWCVRQGGWWVLAPGQQGRTWVLAQGPRPGQHNVGAGTHTPWCLPCDSLSPASPPLCWRSHTRRSAAPRRLLRGRTHG